MQDTVRVSKGLFTALAENQFYSCLRTLALTVASAWNGFCGDPHLTRCVFICLPSFFFHYSVKLPKNGIESLIHCRIPNSLNSAFYVLGAQ